MSDTIRAARAAAGEIRHASTLPPLLKAWSEYRDDAARRQQASRQLEAAGKAIGLLMDACREMCMSLLPLVGPVECQRLWEGYRSAAAAAAKALREGGSPVMCAPPPPLALDGIPYAEWDRARLEVLREEVSDEVVWQRFLARLRADPQRYYPPWTAQT